jgi:hypothetical protein
MHLEKRYKGNGRLAEKDRSIIAPAAYEVEIFRKMVPDGFGGELLGSASVRGSVRGGDPGLMVELARTQKDLILLMDSDGLELSIFVSGLDTFTGRSGLPEPIGVH